MADTLPPLLSLLLPLLPSPPFPSSSYCKHSLNTYYVLGTMMFISDRKKWMRHACLQGTFSLMKKASNQTNSFARLVCSYGHLWGNMGTQKLNIGVRLWIPSNSKIVKWIIRVCVFVCVWEEKQWRKSSNSYKYVLFVTYHLLEKPSVILPAFKLLWRKLEKMYVKLSIEMPGS